MAVCTLSFSRAISKAIYAVLVAMAAASAAATDPVSQNVVLLHGLARSAASMEKLENYLSAAGFKVCNIDYPSRHHRVELLASD